MKVLFLLALFILENHALALPKNKIKLFIWWDYLPQGVLDELEKNGFDPEITTYRSNDMALSRLSHNSEKFDVVVISNVVIDVFRDKLKTNYFYDLTQKRNYDFMFREIPYQCLPYAWGASLYAYNSKFLDIPPASIDDMIRLREKNFTLGIIDDLFELSTRLNEDGKSLSKKNNIDYYKTNLHKEDFLSSLLELKEKSKIVTYGWIGETAALMAKVPDMKYSLPKGRIVLGYDAVCVISKNKVKESKKFVEIMTSKDSIEKVVRSTQYFSPYKIHTEGLGKETIKIRSDIQKKVDSNEYIFLKRSNKDDQIELNKWWRSIRYGT